jgi:Protein of unknown function (DUF2934)
MIVTRTSRSVNTKKERAVASGPNIEQQIRVRAYELYEQNGRIDGHAEQNWLAAELEITRSSTRL